jgi:hypothetical protein
VGNRRLEQDVGFLNRGQQFHLLQESEVSEETMVRDILKIVEDNIDMEIVKAMTENPPSGGTKFRMFSEFIK